MQGDDYRAYMLRMWRIKDNDTTHWRLSLERVDTGEQLGFEGLEALIEYLRGMKEGPPEEDGEGPE